MRRVTSLCLTAALCMSIASARAHEFWIEPERFAVAPNAVIVADLKVGQMRRGEPYPYLSNRFTRFTVTAEGDTVAVAGFEGDVPALSGIPAQPGLNIVAHQTVPFRVTYDDWAVFRRYLADEGLDQFADLHSSRGLPDAGFSERYTRYAKALIQSGPVRPGDRDAPLGFPLELVVETNPFVSGLDHVEVSLLWQGAPLAGHQVTVLSDDGKTVTRRALRTDRAGTAVVALNPDMTYLLNAVRLEPAEHQPVVWQSHWASTTFSTTGNDDLWAVD